MSRTYKPGRLLRVVRGNYDISMDYEDGEVLVGDVVMVKIQQGDEIDVLVFRSGKTVVLYQDEVRPIPKPRKKANVSDR